MKNLIHLYRGSKTYFKLIPFLLLYLTIVIIFSNSSLVGDENRYLWFTNNLLHGFYSPDYPNINLWNGPGYPFILIPFVFLKLPLIFIKLLNGFFLYFALLINFKTFRIYSSEKKAFLYTVLMGLYFPVFHELPFILTECLTWLLVSLVCHLFIKTYRLKSFNWSLILATSFTISFLAMTKLIFGYVILAMILVSLILIFISHTRDSAIKSSYIFSLSFLLCIPWLLYTYHITNKPFYWTNSGSMSLYTMSTPFEGEFGDWKSEDELVLNPNHTFFIDRIKDLNPLQKDYEYKREAINNIACNPKKYFLNWISNVGRLFFNYPYTNLPQGLRPFFHSIPNMFILVPLILSLFYGNTIIKSFPQELILLLLFFIIYLFGCSLVSTYPRMFYITIPYWITYLFYFFNNTIFIQVKER